MFAASCVLVSVLLTSVAAVPQRPPMGPPPPMGGPGGWGPPPPMGGPGGFGPPPPMGGPGGWGPPPPPCGGQAPVPLDSGNCPIDPAKNKALVSQAYQEVFGDHNVANIEKYFAKDFIEHNPNDADGSDALKNAILNGPLGQGPPFKVDFKRVASDGDLVWTHSVFPFMGKNLAVVDIFKVKCGKIVEHWDVQQDMDIGRPAANAHPFF